MPKFVTVINVDSTNNTLHFTNLDIADVFSQIFNSYLGNQFCSFTYDGNTCQVTPHSEDLESEIIAQQINCFIEWNDKYPDRNDYLDGYLINDCFPILEKDYKNITFPLFKNLYLKDFLDDTSANYIKDRINEKIIALS